MKTATSPTQWADNIDSLADNGSLRQRMWNREEGGKHLACLLGAAGPEIHGVESVPCAALCMPDWMAPLTVSLFDGVSMARAGEYGHRYAAVVRGWCVLDDKAWDRISVAFRIECIEQALASAEAVQPTPKLGYWDAVQDACGMMVTALKSGDPAQVQKAAAAAWEARAAAGAEAAEAAAGEAAGAAWAAAGAGEAAWAAWAAAGAAAAAWAAWAAAGAAGAAATAATAAAWAAAYEKLFDKFLSLITDEIETTKTT